MEPMNRYGYKIMCKRYRLYESLVRVESMSILSGIHASRGGIVSRSSVVAVTALSSPWCSGTHHTQQH